ncbi:hypothetical protein EQH23_00035 [Streptococcus pneumoniae]|nr:hypothetical protein C1H54_00035 [Streptococcus pneumoniae]TNW43253.1 hypothetical protein FIU68_02645 [Streptococcus pneumoniae]UKP57430.1 hypothetical protein EQH23_00035 [Streptococcus pneumoniae]UKP79480.1 hypothetical protein ES298_00035 [Streptococcus pneumoniae]
MYNDGVKLIEVRGEGDIATFSAFARSSTHITLPFSRHIYCHYLSKISPFLTLGKPLYLVVTLGLLNTQP